ncbi:MAG: uroporphyrinogen-III decarboxylase-like protein [Planctomycetota bacterium]|nr:uroporphyrinogen-III decarboxylase-like protein [Planctomycetota bacterium]
MVRVTKREVVIEALAFRPPPYVPWAWEPTARCAERLAAHLGAGRLEAFIDTHFLDIEPINGRFEPLGNDRWRDTFGVVWDRSVDKDIGIPLEWPLRRPEDLAGYRWPDISRDSLYACVADRVKARPGLFTRYLVGFSLYERAWTMRGLADLLADMILRPDFVEDLLDRIVEHNLIQVHKALRLPIDAVYFGDDYGMQTGLIMGLDRWRHFFKPRLARLFAPVREAGKFVFLHSCGKVDAILDDLVQIGLSAFNPFQPEVMDVFAVKKRYHGRLAFHGGMSIQKILPFGTVREVRDMAARLVEAGRQGGYIFSPSHAVPPDVPPENLVAMMEVLRAQPGYAV